MKIHIGSNPAPDLQLEVHTLAAGAPLEVPADGRERVIVLLGGHCAVDLDKGNCRFENLGRRADVFDGPATAVYIPRRQGCRIRAEDGGARLVLVSATAGVDHQPYTVLPEEVHIERRGSGAWMRSVHDIIGPRQPADRLLLGETFSRNGVWSGYPPHRHDRSNPPFESRLDEIFLVRVRPATGFGLLVHYPSEDAREQAATVRDGDLVTVTGGYHSFVAAAEHDFYYLWALAGDARRLTMFTDPRHRWVLSSRAPQNDDV